MRTLVVVPTYLEVENIGEALTRVREAAPDVDILVVDDNSPDGTGALAEKTATELGQIDVLHRPSKTGLGAAYRDGFALGIDRGYEILVQMDADLSHDAASLPDLLAHAYGGADLTIGSRYVPGGRIPHWPWHRRWLSRFGNRYAGFMLSCGVRDMTSGFRAYRVPTLLAVEYAGTRAMGYGFQIELAYRVSRWGGKIVETPIIFSDRVRGHSKMSISVAFEELWLVTWWSIRDRPWWGRRRRAARRQGTQLPKNASTE
ncbi:MAG: polyprenol monophosphomannose synthase [Acidimicrobiia bacterium]